MNVRQIWHVLITCVITRYCCFVCLILSFSCTFVFNLILRYEVDVAWFNNQCNYLLLVLLLLDFDYYNRDESQSYVGVYKVLKSGCGVIIKKIFF